MESNSNIIETDIVIIGAGLTGLTTAHYLNKLHKKFIVLEKKDRVGGVIHSVREDEFLYEEGPNTGLISNSAVANLFDDISNLCEVEIAKDSVKKRYILKNGNWCVLPMGLFQGITTPLFTFKDKLRVLGEPFRARSVNPHEDLSSLVIRRLGKSFLNYAVDPFILGVYAGNPAKLITKYALPKLYALEQDYGSFIGGAIKKKFQKKDAETKKITKKTFSFKGGLNSLTKALYDSSGHNKFLLQIQDIAVNTTSEGYVVTGKKTNGENISIKAKHIITTIGAYALESLLPFIPKSDMAKLISLKYAKVIEVVLGFKQWNGIKLDAFGGLIPFKEKRDIIGILFMSAFLNNRVPVNGALFTIFMGGVRRPEIMNLSDNEIFEIIEKESKNLLFCPVFKPDLFKIIHHSNAIPQYGKESGERFETIHKIEKKYAGLVIGGNLRDGIGMADRIKQGEKLANFNNLLLKF